MDHKILLGVVGALVLVAASGVQAHEAPKPRTLSVSGEGEVRVAPDRADLSFTVEARERALADAEAKVSEAVARFLKLCETAGIDKNRIKTAQHTVQPDYDYGNLISNRPKIVGYFVARDLEVDLVDLGKLGRLIQGALEAGVNRVSGPAFGSSKEDEYEREALAKAAQDARANAEILAKTLGVKLGALHTLTAQGNVGEPRPMLQQARAKMAYAEAAPSQTYEPGEIRFEAAVTAEFELAAP